MDLAVCTTKRSSMSRHLQSSTRPTRPVLSESAFAAEKLEKEHGTDNVLIGLSDVNAH